MKCASYKIKLTSLKTSWIMGKSHAIMHALNICISKCCTHNRTISKTVVKFNRPSRSEIAIHYSYHRIKSQCIFGFLSKWSAIVHFRVVKLNELSTVLRHQCCPTPNCEEAPIEPPQAMELILYFRSRIYAKLHREACPEHGGYATASFLFLRGL